MGFKKIILPKGQADKFKSEKIKVIGVKNLKEAIHVYEG